ncbi:DNA topoisomerase 3 [Bilophila wadsworthia]|uniref:DNA topoisomerase 3 n=3 Tax=Bilophila wadsworthia TaxID=35833 RepID=UPI001D0BD03C|nr:DNA topoisomerase 3 [Bilophila wadsworthia]MCB8572372.1 DNA topoisomerase 3 [Bilophila wadsworthia]
MRLFIAEKPSLGKAIAAELGVTQTCQGYMVCGNDVVTWCFGHLLEQYDPDDYNETWKLWRRSSLPMIPRGWRLKPKKDALTQLQIINHLLSEAATVVNAGDPDREGQLLVDEVLEHFSYYGPVQRIWLASLDSRSIQKALATLKDNRDYANLRDSARARSQADWLIGMNATRAMTLRGKESGRDGVLSMGRVQTPTLALVVNRDREIAAFTPIDYLILQATLQHDAGMFSAIFKPSETQPGLDSEGRLVDGATAQGIMDAVRGKNGIITSVTREKKKKPVPLPHCLSSLQKAASSKLGMTAQQVLDTAQSLYEKKLTTYPRTDCRYLPEEQFSDAARIITALSGVSGLEAVTAKADSALRGPVWDTKKITAHHAIIPTGELPKSLSKEENALYLMIAVQYFLQFYPPMLYEAQKILATIVETAWEARGRMIIEPGWTGFAAEEDDEDAKKKEAEQSLPSVGNNDAVLCADVDALKKKTTPPSRFSEGSLIEAMANVHRFVSDASAKTVLKENEGLGTEATRASIIETLKGRKYIEPNGKSLVSTPLGQSLINMTPDVLKDPITTAEWEQRLEQIAHGETTLDAFMQEQIAILPSLLDPVLSRPVVLLPNAFPCPKCGKAMHKRPDKKFGGFFWACSDPDCRSFLPDDSGKPGTPREQPVPSEFPCPACGKPLYRKEKEGKPYWACYNREDHANGENIFLPDNAGKPGQPKPRTPRIVTESICPDCGKPLLIRQGTNAKGPWTMFSCSGFPQCKASFWDKDGKPNFNNRVKR